MKWNKTSESIPPDGVEVLGFNSGWIDDDFSPEGIMVCFQNTNGESLSWVRAKWDNDMDIWETIYDDPPLYWIYKDNPPKVCPKCMNELFLICGSTDSMWHCNCGYSK